MIIQNEHTFVHALEQGYNLFTGAGFSILAKSKGRTLPVGDELKNELITTFGKPEYSGLTLSQLSTVLRKQDNQRFNEYLRDRYTVSEFDAKYMNITKTNVKSYLTTNIDNLPFKIYNKSKDHYINDVRVTGPGIVGRGCIDFLPLHGSVENQEADYRFTTAEISSDFNLDVNKWQMLISKMSQHPTLFVGYSVADTGVINSLNDNLIGKRQVKDKWIVLRKGDDGTVAYFRAMGFNTIIGDLGDLLLYLHDVRAKSNQELTGNLVTENFPDLLLPPPGSIPNRPLNHFIMGSEPEWYDIYSEKIPSVDKLKAIKNDIIAGKNSFIAGIPGSGKTTILKQLAYSLSRDFNVLFGKDITIEQSRYLVRTLNSERALIFIDNAADSIDALINLSNEKNITVIGADREYEFETVSHKLTRGKFNVINATNLTREDIQLVYNFIPEIQRIPKLRIPSMHHNCPPSLYEVIQENVKESKINDRVVSLLKKSEFVDKRMVEVLTLICYLHYCRSVATFETITSFVSDDTYDYILANRLLDGLGSLVQENVMTSETLKGEIPDTFSPRSNIFSDAVLDSVKPNILKFVLETFHSKISRYMIPNYQTFKRNAFEQRLCSKAFASVDDGIRFYENMKVRDRSPYLLQQGALYFLGKRQYDMAFKYIDDAKLETGGRIQTINNTHAVVLFESNYDKNPTDDRGRNNKRDNLTEALNSLEKCYEHDDKKIHHAAKYGDFSIKYYQAYPDDPNAKVYLEKALRWVSEEAQNNDWNFKLKRVQKELRKFV